MDEVTHVIMSHKDVNHSSGFDSLINFLLSLEIVSHIVYKAILQARMQMRVMVASLRYVSNGVITFKILNSSDPLSLS